MKKVTKAIKICNFCGVEFFVFPHRKDTAKFCSRSCVGKHTYNIPDVFKKFNTHKVGSKHHLFGKKLTREHRDKISLNHADMNGEKSPTWKGDDVGYFGVHDWITKHYGQPLGCEVCGLKDKDKKYHWANLTGKYRRDREDFARMCVSCHHRYDGQYVERWSKLIRSTRWAK